MTKRSARWRRVSRRLNVLWSILGIGLMIALVVYISGATLVWRYAQDRAQQGLEARYPVPDQIAAVVQGMNRVSGEDRQILMRAINGAGLQVSVAADPARPEPGSLSEGKLILSVVRDYLRDEAEALDADTRLWLRRRKGFAFYVQEVVVTSRLRDGQYMTLVISDSVLGRLAALWTIVGIGGFLLVFLAALLVVIRRVAAPLSTIAAAADRLGENIAAPPLPEEGVAEIRQVAAAFNQMQRRIVDLVEQRTRLLAGIAHDMRTLLTRLRMRLEYIPDKDMRQKSARDLDFLVRIIDRHLDFAREDDWHEPKTPTDLTALVQDICDDALEAGEPVSLIGPDRLVVAIRPDAMRRAVSNLVQNAVEYAGSAEVVLQHGADQVTIDVKDRGPGIDPTMRPLLFEPFSRPSTATGRHPNQVSSQAGADLDHRPHAGLGLALSYTIIRGHGGRIDLIDRPGGGLIARLTLPS
ncbi:MAG: ATP-binding protein [Alphaproteobacteria bacterium]